MKTILLVDDDDSIRSMYRGLLQGEGYGVVEAENVQKATDCLLSTQVDLVLLDINMPEESGVELKKMLDALHRKIKIIVASVYPLYMQKRLMGCVDGYYDKAHSPQFLLAKIHLLMDSGVQGEMIEEEVKLNKLKEN